MKAFHCDHCGNLLFFENVKCVQCSRLLAFLSDLWVVGSLEPAGEPDVWKSPLARAAGRKFRLCQNYSAENVCNWAIPAEDANPLCRSCRLTTTIPNLSEPGRRKAWYQLEAAKRRLVYTLLGLGLPVRNRTEDPKGGLAFEFLADTGAEGTSGENKILTGHENGTITINVAEADSAEREKRRTQMHEPFRTLLGHFRHEVGHYYWDRLVRDRPCLDGFRQLFGDERANYAEALKHHYAAGPPDNWQAQFVSAYAASHPWEDWAETWAHYLHMVDALETAASCGLSLKPTRQDEPTLGAVPNPLGETRTTFDELYADWFPLTYMLNALSRGLGQPDSYPFVLSAPAVEKLRFVHELIHKD